MDVQIVTEGKTMDEIAQQVAFKWRRTLIDWTWHEEENYLSVLLTNLAHKIRINIPDGENHMPVKKGTPPADLPRASMQSRGAGSSSKAAKKFPDKFEGPHALARTAEMIADDNKGQVMQYKHYPDEEVLVVLLTDGRKFRVNYPPQMVPE